MRVTNRSGARSADDGLERQERPEQHGHGTHDSAVKTSRSAVFAKRQSSVINPSFPSLRSRGGNVERSDENGGVA